MFCTITVSYMIYKEMLLLTALFLIALQIAFIIHNKNLQNQIKKSSRVWNEKKNKKNFSHLRAFLS